MHTVQCVVSPQSTMMALVDTATCAASGCCRNYYFCQRAMYVTSLGALIACVPPHPLPPPPASIPRQMGLSEPACSGTCAGGHFCPSGSTSPFQHKCGRLGLYCPVGASEPSDVLQGYYGVHSGPEADLQVNTNIDVYGPIVHRHCISYHIGRANDL